jgi:hypothetical protein
MLIDGKNLVYLRVDCMAYKIIEVLWEGKENNCIGKGKSTTPDSITPDGSYG